MRTLLAALVLSVSLAACSHKTAPPAPQPTPPTVTTTTTDNSTTSHTMHGSGQIVPPPAPYKELCKNEPEGCV